MKKINQDYKTTSIKIPSELTDDFKILSIKSKMNMQKILERSMFLYVQDEEFRTKIDNTYNTLYTGSSKNK